MAEESDVVETLVSHHVRPYNKLLSPDMQLDGSRILGIELDLLRYLYHESKVTFMKFPLQASSLLAFFICKEMEIRDIIAILAGKQLELSQERIRSYIVTLQE